LQGAEVTRIHAGTGIGFVLRPASQTGAGYRDAAAGGWPTMTHVALDHDRVHLRNEESLYNEEEQKADTQEFFHIQG
jgi:hypothetical protein